MDILDLLPCQVPLRLETLRWSSGGLRLELTATAASAKCPLCSQLSTRVHSHYHRTLADLPCSGVAVRLELCAPKFFCDNPRCNRRIFTPPLPQLAARYARRTLRLQAVLQMIGLALGGEAGARLSRELHLATSGDTILRALHHWHPLMATTPRVLGVDDFAFRRGRTYGTILVDLEKHRVTDLLPDRQAPTLTAWLQEHPGVEIISRDRSAEYALGARLGAPNALQVADRWHLLKNLADALENLLIREHSALREAAQAHQDTTEDTAHTNSPSPAPVALTLLPLPRLEREKQQRRGRRLARYQQVMQLYSQGVTLRGIAQATGVSRETVRHFVQAGQFPEITPRSPRPTKLDDFSDYLKVRWDTGCHNAAQLFRELRDQGYTGHQTLVKDYIRAFRSGLAAPQQIRGPTPSAASSSPPSVRCVLWWLLRPDEQLEAQAQQFVARLCHISSSIRTARELALWFFRMVRERRAQEFGDWIAFARDSRLPYLKGFAQRLLSDRAAVIAALSQPWSNGQTEGQVNRLKSIKRQMYGRAGFELLRARVLAAV
jgi:transposase